jgi:cyclopropane fatty-acyl-phospholipid synthase-like methyltransferase
MGLTTHERQVADYYDRNTEDFYLRGWDAEHIHLGIFREDWDQVYQVEPQIALLDRKRAVETMTEAIVAPARIKESDVVLDAGCGVGGTILSVAGEYGCAAIGLNICQKQISIARQRTQRAGLENRVSFLSGDCSQSSPFADESFDVIINIESACHFSNREKFIFECARTLKPGGRIVGQDWMSQNGISKENLQDYIAPLRDAWFLAELETLESYRSLLERAGFKVLELEYIEKGILPNGYLMQLGHQIVCSWEAERGLSAPQMEYKEQFRTFSRALLGGHLKVGRYLAQKS